MFTGIIEKFGTIVSMEQTGTNFLFRLQSELASELKIDQSLAHDGVCLTVVALGPDWHEVVAIEETLSRTCLGQWQPGRKVNLERAMVANARLDGHIVQGHVDSIAVCTQIIDRNGSWDLRFRIPPTKSHLLVDKGSVCINGISLTVVSPTNEDFGVSIIPYTWENTNMNQLQIDQVINLEYDIIGKYVARMVAHY